MRLRKLPPIGLAIALGLTLAACSSGHDPAVTSQPTSATSTAAVVPQPAPATKAAADASGEIINEPLTADQVNVKMSLEGVPTLSRDGQSIDADILLENLGKTTLPSSGVRLVHLGAHSANASGKIIDNDLARAAISNLAPGSKTTVAIQLPLDKTLGNYVQILPVQENVAWFDAFGTKPLTIGPFNRCAAPASGICNADGKPLASSQGD